MGNPHISSIPNMRDSYHEIFNILHLYEIFPLFYKTWFKCHWFCNFFSFGSYHLGHVLILTPQSSVTHFTTFSHLFHITWGMFLYVHHGQNHYELTKLKHELTESSHRFYLENNFILTIYLHYPLPKYNAFSL